MYYIISMKSLNVRLPDILAAGVERESRRRGVSKSDLVRQCLERELGAQKNAPTLDAIADVIGSVDGLPEDLSSRVDYYLRKTGFGRDHGR
jgi:hypothetical protein